MIWTVVRLGVAASLIAVVAGAGAGHAQKSEKLLLAYSSPVQGSDSTFLFAGKQLGFFSEQGVDLDIQTTPGSVAAAGFIASGAMDIALGGLEAVPGYVLQNVPMKAVYLYANRPIFSIGFLKGSKVQKVADMKGTKIGVVTLGSGSIPVLQYMLKEAGLTMNDVTLVPLGLGSAAVAAIKKGEVESISYHDTAFPLFAANGVEFSQLFVSPKLQQGYAGQGIYAQERTLAGKRAAVEGFLRGLTKSLAYASKDPAGATRAFGQLVPEVAKNPKLEEAAWRERMKIIPVAAPGQWGAMNRTDWENLLDVLVIGGVVKDKPPLEKLYTTDFLKAANQVDLTKLP
jgi:NitT/TauT family transport system substrate-binding protein